MIFRETLTYGEILGYKMLRKFNSEQLLLRWFARTTKKLKSQRSAENIEIFTSFCLYAIVQNLL